MQIKSNQVMHFKVAKAYNEMRNIRTGKIQVKNQNLMPTTIRVKTVKLMLLLTVPHKEHITLILVIVTNFP